MREKQLGVIHGYFNTERDMEDMLGDKVGKTGINISLNVLLWEEQQQPGALMNVCVYSHYTNTGYL